MASVESSYPTRGVGAVLNGPVASKVEANTELARFLPTVDLSPNSSDFLYQINRPRQLTLPGSPNLMVNRISKWSVVRWRRGVISASGGQVTMSPTVDATAYRLELDINTDASFKGELPHERLGEVFEFLVRLGVEISQRGDIE